MFFEVEANRCLEPVKCVNPSALRRENAALQASSILDMLSDALSIILSSNHSVLANILLSYQHPCYSAVARKDRFSTKNRLRCLTLIECIHDYYQYYQNKWR